jgi:hypothetical protein
MKKKMGKIQKNDKNIGLFFNPETDPDPDRKPSRKPIPTDVKKSIPQGSTFWPCQTCHENPINHFNFFNLILLQIFNFLFTDIINLEHMAQLSVL